MREGRVYRLPQTGPPAAKMVRFLGGRLAFPQVLLQLIQAEVEDVDVARIELQALEDGRDRPALNCLIFEESLARDLSEGWAPEPADRAGLLWVYAYRDIALARQLLRRQGDLGLALQLRFLPLGMPLSSFVALLRIILAGDVVVPGELLNHHAPPPLVAEDGVHLTRREHEVLALTVHGHRNKVIAYKLGVSEHTVKLHMHHIISKIGATNRTQAAQWYQRRGQFDARE